MNFSTHLTGQMAKRNILSTITIFIHCVWPNFPNAATLNCKSLVMQRRSESIFYLFHYKQIVCFEFYFSSWEHFGCFHFFLVFIFKNNTFRGTLHSFHSRSLMWTMCLGFYSIFVLIKTSVGAHSHSLFSLFLSIAMTSIAIENVGGRNRYCSISIS